MSKFLEDEVFDTAIDELDDHLWRAIRVCDPIFHSRCCEEFTGRAERMENSMIRSFEGYVWEDRFFGDDQ